MSRQLYTVIYCCLVPLILLRLLFRSIKAPAYRQRMLERFGYFPAPDSARQNIWIHAVSVGEAIAARPLLNRLRQDYPGMQLVVTTTTPTGSETVRQLYGDSVFHVYSPYETPGALARFMGKIRPRMLVIMETELWPNMIHACHEKNIPVLLANGRLSEKSMKGYQRFGGLTSSMLKQLSAVAAQYQTDGDRYLQLGLPENKLVVTGTIKFDLDISAEQRSLAELFREQWHAGGPDTVRVLLAASTHPGEDEMLLRLFSKLQSSKPETVLVLVPRHPERFEEVYSLVQEAGFSVMRRSENRHADAGTKVVVVDSMGEMLSCFGAADVCFVGGSMIQHGGHNLMEPAAWGRAIVTGDSLYNFSEVSRLMQQDNCLKIVSDEEGLFQALQYLLEDDVAARQYGEKAFAFYQDHRGAVGRLCEQVNNLMP
jgi:3-deoxy-D-manno-octulosonic-acid transferase